MVADDLVADEHIYLSVDDLDKGSKQMSAADKDHFECVKEKDEITMSTTMENNKEDDSESSSSDSESDELDPVKKYELLKQ